LSLEARRNLQITIKNWQWQLSSVFPQTNLSAFKWIAELISRFLFLNCNLDVEFRTNRKEFAAAGMN
jgi:hypothetical protein